MLHLRKSLTVFGSTVYPTEPVCAVPVYWRHESTANPSSWWNNDQGMREHTHILASTKRLPGSAWVAITYVCRQLKQHRSRPILHVIGNHMFTVLRSIHRLFSHGTHTDWSLRTYSLSHGSMDLPLAEFCTRPLCCRLWGHKLKLLHMRFRLNWRKAVFSVRIAGPRNRVPAFVVE